jgi:two-component system response regulator VicR
MTNQDDDLSRLKTWLVEDTGSELETERLLPVAVRLRGMSGLARLLSRETYVRHSESDSQRAIVCIDDDAAMIDLVCTILKHRGFDVIGATSGVQGLELVSSVKPDVVLLDLMMTEMDGWDVYQHMKMDEQMRTVPVIVVSAKSQAVDKELGLYVAKVQDYLTKPFSADELLKSIHRVLGMAGSGA